MIDPEVLKLIDQSISKWRNIVFRGSGQVWAIKCPLCSQFSSKCWNSSWSDPDSDRCPVFKKTGEESCFATPFYKTTVWYQPILTSENYSQYAVKDNFMLSLLYEVRLAYINGKL